MYKNYLLLRNFPLNNINHPIEKITGENKKLIILFGDSRISNWHSFPHSDNLSTFNAGFAGYTSEQLKHKLQAYVIELNPDVVILQFGINDLVTIGVSKENYSRITSQLKNNILSMISELEKHSIKTIITTIIPNRPISLQRMIFWSEEINKGIQEINNYISTLSYQHLIAIRCDNLLSNNKLLLSEYSKDDLHLNSAGYRVLNDCVSPYIHRLIGDSIAF